MVDEQLLAEDALQPLGQLGRERNLGYQIEYLPLLLQQIADKMYVYLGFAA